MIYAPSFWYEQKTLKEKMLKRALTPCGWLYGWIVGKRFDLYFPVPMSKPVICVGNFVAGGAGKTPVVLSLTDILQDQGYNPHLLTRGYGGTETGPLQVSPGRDTADDVGDEALLLVEKAPTWVSRNRAIGAQEAMDSGANIVVMDDGLQNPVIYKDFSFAVIDGAVGLGNKQVMPAGPLRENIKNGLNRADAIVVIGEDKTGAVEYIQRFTKIPVFFASLVPDTTNPLVKDKKVVAFAGIGRPQKFYETLQEAGAEIVGWTEFPDHFPYADEDLLPIIADAEAQGAILLTTTKDHVRLSNALRQKIKKFSVHLVWQNPSDIMPLIEQALQKRMK